MGTVRVLRVYEHPEPGEYRVLVDRLWPRGIKKELVDIWLRDVAPSTEVRNTFHHEAERFDEFVHAYTAELESNPAVNELRDIIKEHQRVVLLYGAKDKEQNQAAVLLEYLKGKA